MNFSIIIPNYNGSEFLPDCLKSISHAINHCPESNFEIIIVDNGSSDNSILLFKKLISSLKIKNYKLIVNRTNLGFAKAVNQGILAAKNDFVILQNNDLTIIPEWFSLINHQIHQSTNTKIVVYAGQVLNKTGSQIESQGLNFSYRGKCQNINNGLPYIPSNTNAKPVIIWGASAAIIVYHRQTLIDIGLFDEDFFAYEEDVDLALRLHNFGYQTLYLPSAISYHLGGGTSRKMGNFRHQMDLKNWLFIIIKNYSITEIVSNIFPIIEERLRNLSGLVKNTPFHSLPKTLITILGIIIKTLPSMLKKRKQLQLLLKSQVC